METIPQIVLDYAHNEGFNTVEFVCDDYNGFAVYAVGIRDKNGMLVPIGFPDFILLSQDRQMRFAREKERGELLRRL